MAFGRLCYSNSSFVRHSLVGARTSRRLFSDRPDLDELDGGFDAPIIKTAVPGPKSLELKSRMNQVLQSGTVNFFVDYSRSHGNYVTDVDGNVMLDLFGQYATLAVGYNNHRIREHIESAGAIDMLVSRPALGIAPPMDYLERIQASFLSVAPSGMNRVQPMMCGACSNEHAFKTSFIMYMRNKRGGSLPSNEDLDSCLRNKPPGSPKLSIMSFNGAFHGRTMACLSVTHSKPIHKLDIPALDWPVAPFPQLRYPLEENVRENHEEENKCLEQVEDLFESSIEMGVPVAGLIVEPIQSEGGDRHASNDFFIKLQSICQRNGAAFIVDEVQTGCGATGHMWAHEAWNIVSPPDIVTFAKKMQLGGYFTRPGIDPQEPLRIFNTWLGDPARLIVLEGVVKEIKTCNLLELVRVSGKVLLDGLKDLEARYPGLVMNARGKGTLCALDCASVELRAKLIFTMMNKGFVIQPCGLDSIRLRPSLVFQPKHAEMFLNEFQNTLNGLA